MEQMLLKRVTEENFSVALKIQNTIFPDYNARENYLQSISGESDNIYWIIYAGDIAVGISGIYNYPVDDESAWLGWFGILSEYRKCGYGSKALELFEKEALRQGYKFARLYTERYNNDVARRFYEKNGYICEKYDNKEDPACYEYPIDIYSKALRGKYKAWNNKYIGFTKQVELQSR